jgi:hypothetical protein
MAKLFTVLFAVALIVVTGYVYLHFQYSRGVHVEFKDSVDDIIDGVKFNLQMLSSAFSGGNPPIRPESRKARRERAAAEAAKKAAAEQPPASPAAEPSP